MATLKVKLAIGLALILGLALPSAVQAASYYVNDAATAGDAWCSAVGNDVNNGTSPATPKASVQAVLDTYDLEPGDTVYIDTGTYALSANITVESSDQGEEGNPVVFAASPYGVTIDRGSTGATDYVWHINNADYVTLTTADSSAQPAMAKRWLRLTGGRRALYVQYSAYITVDKAELAGNSARGLYDIGGDYNSFSHLLIHDNGSEGIYLTDSDNALVANTTIVGNGGDAIYISSNSSPVTLTNNILWADGGGNFAIYLESTNVPSADFNLFHLSNGALVGFMVTNRSDLVAWQRATGQDYNSQGGDPLLVNTASGDYHLQSTGGSYHDGAWSADASSSPGLDAGDPSSAFGDEPAANGGRINLGAYGGTILASKSPTGRRLTLLQPLAGQAPRGPIGISWLATGQGWGGGDLLTLEYSANNGSDWTTIASDVPYQRASQPATVATQDVETGLEGWTTDGDWARSTESAHGGSYAFSDTPGGNYAAGSDRSLYSPPYNVSHMEDLTLTFWAKWDLGTDEAYVEVSVDGGASWQTEDIYTGQQSSWAQQTLDLSAYAGYPSLHIRFQVLSWGESHDGLYVDDLSLTGTTRPDTYVWDTAGATSGPFYKVRITANPQPAVQDVNDPWFTLHNGPITYYVNDAATTNDAWCGAAGNDANDGLSPATPKATVMAILNTYNLEPGDILRMDTGTYSLSADLTVTAADQGSAVLPVVFSGSPYGVTINRNGGGSGKAWEFKDVDYATLETAVIALSPPLVQRWMRLTGANYGLHIDGGMGVRAQRLECTGNTDGVVVESSAYAALHNLLIHANSGRGIYFFDSDIAWVVNCTVLENGGSEVYLGSLNTNLNLQFRNNIVWADGAGDYAVNVTTGAPLGSSDYNDLYATNSASVGYYGGSARATLGDWRTATGEDANSISTDPLFLNQAGDDFHPKSLTPEGTYDLSQGIWVQSDSPSPVVDAGDPGDDAGQEPENNGNRVNLGTYGATNQASKSQDSDGDGLLDVIETAPGSCTDPYIPDSDNDGLLDGQEDANHNGQVDEGETSPCDDDSDNDGMKDGWEVNNGLDPLVDDSGDDDDGDLYTNLEEYTAGTEPDDPADHPGPEILLKRGITDLLDGGGPIDFGTLQVGQETALGFTIENSGIGALTLSGTPAVQVSGSGASSFVVTTQPTSPVAADDQSGFVITFRPQGGGTLSATVSIASDDRDETPYTFTVTGIGEVVGITGFLDLILESGDTDGDGIPDYLESGGCTSPTESDSDGDGIPDGSEDANKNGQVDPGETNPCSTDSDGDGMDDFYEVSYGLAATDPGDAGLDPDGDGFSNLQEWAAGTDPTDPDSKPGGVISVLFLLLLD